MSEGFSLRSRMGFCSWQCNAMQCNEMLVGPVRESDRLIDFVRLIYCFINPWDEHLFPSSGVMRLRSLDGFSGSLLLNCISHVRKAEDVSRQAAEPSEE